MVFNDISNHLKSKHPKTVKHYAEAIESNEILTVTYRKHQTVDLKGHFWCSKISLHQQQQVGDAAVLPAKVVQSRPSQVQFYLVSMFDEKDDMNSWVYIHGSPHDAKQFEYSISLIGSNASNFRYRGFVKPLDKESTLITSEGLLLFIQKKAFNTCRIKAEEYVEWVFEVTIRDLQDKTDEKNGGVIDDALKVKAEPELQPLSFKNCLSRVKRKMSSSTSKPDLSERPEANCDLKKDTKNEDVKSGF